MDQVTKQIIIKVAPWLILGIIVAIIILVILGKFKNIFGLGEDKDDKVSAQNQASEIDLIKVDPSKKSFPEGNYISMANSLEAAMSGLGSSDSEVANTLSLVKNQTDWNYLIKVFGIREGENLLSWIRGDFDVAPLTGLSRKNLNAILMARGVTTYLI